MNTETTDPRTAQARAQQSLKYLQAALRAASKRPEKEKSIHDLRVTIRRFKQVLRIYAAYFDRTGKMRRGLRSLMDLCGEARNCDVAVEVLEAAGVPAARSLKRELTKRRAKATRDLAHELKDWHIRAHMRRWREWLTVKAGEDPAAKPSIPELSGEFLKSGAAAARAEAAYQEMHKFRLLVKKTRYAAEILGAPKARLETLRALQDRLGAINDCVTTGDLLADLNLHGSERRKLQAAVKLLAAKRCGEFRAYWSAHFGRKGRIE
jgi:CHAD domain-containing protein